MAPDFRPGGTLSGGLYAGENPYPLPRGDRRTSAIPGGAGAAAVVAPRVFNWFFHLREFGAGRAVALSRRLAGPAFVDELALEWNVSTAGAVTLLQIGWSVSPQTEGSGLPVADLPSVTWFYEKDYQDDGGFADVAQDGQAFGWGGATVHSVAMRIGRPVQAPEFFLVASLRVNGGTTTIYNGSMRVVENLDPESLADLVLS